MRILLLTSALDRGGAETHIVTLAQALAARGHTVCVASAGGRLVGELTARGIAHVTLPLDRRSPHAVCRARSGLRRLLARENFSVIHAHARLPALLIEGLARRRGIPFVTTVHAHFRTGGLARRLSRWGMRTVAVSEDLKHYVCTEYGVPPEQVTVIPNGIDLRAFSRVERQATDTDKLRLLFLSRLDCDCSLGAFLLCRIAPRLKVAFPTLEILIAGGGDAYAELCECCEALARRSEEPFVRCVGHVDRPAESMRAAQVVVGVSRVALEAMACGTPVILGGDEGFGGVVDEENFSWLALSNFCCRGCAPMREDNLYDACVRLLSLSREERTSLGTRLAALVQARNGIDSVAKRTEQLYVDAITGARSAQVGHGKRILCGYYGFGNTGDDALLSAAIARAKRDAPASAISAMTKRGRRDSARFGVRCVRRTSPIAVLRELSGAECLIYGGGTLLQESTSLRSLLYYTALLRYAQRRGVRTELWANGLGEIDSPLGIRMMRAALLGCAHVGLRDKRSLELARSLLGARANGLVHAEEDLARHTPPAEADRVAFLLRHYGLERDFAVVAPKGHTSRGSLKILREWLCVLRAEGVRLLFVPLFGREDTALCRRLCEHPNDRIAEGLSASDLVGIMARARAVCGMRLHALIFAASAYTPFVGFGTDPKIESFCRENGGLYFTDLY